MKKLDVKYEKVKFCDCGQLDFYKSEVERLKNLCKQTQLERDTEIAKQMKLLVENAALRITTAPESANLISWQIISSHVKSLEDRIDELTREKCDE